MEIFAHLESFMKHLDKLYFYQKLITKQD